MTPEEVHKRIKIIDGEKIFEGDLDLGNKKLYSLKRYNLSDVIIAGSFACDGNKLKSLKHSPKQVNCDFWCYGNNLTTLEGLSKSIGRLIRIEKEVLQRLYFTNPLVSLYVIQDKFDFTVPYNHEINSFH